MMKMLIQIAALAVSLCGISAVDLRYVDDTVDPCTDFYQFACGNFPKYNTRPENQPSVDLFTQTADALIRTGNEIVSSPKRPGDGVALKKAKAFYKACVEVEEVDRLYYYNSPEKRIIEEFGGLPLVTNETLDKISFSQIGEIAGEFGIHQLFQFTIANFDPEKYIVILLKDTSETAEMIRPESVPSYDEILEESFRKLAATEKRLLQTEDPFDAFFWKTGKYLLSIHGVVKSDEELQSELNDIKLFMSQLFNGGDYGGYNWTAPDDITTLGNLQRWTRQQFGDEIDISWVDFFRQHFKWANVAIDESFVVYLAPPEIIYGVLNLIRKTDPRVVKNFIVIRAFLYMAPDSSSYMRSAFDEYYDSLGLPHYNRSEYCARKILDVVDTASLSFAVSNDFVQYHFDVNKIPEAVKIISDTKATFKEALETLDWLDDESRASVKEKLDNIVVFLGYPDFVENRDSLDRFYDNVRICEWDNYGNAKRIRAFKQAYAFSEYANHDLWKRSPFEVNAYAVRQNNRILSPVSMLQSQFFSGGDPLFDYSRYGSIIAHEFTHHFDKSGIGYNTDAFQAPLLSDASTKKFKEKIQCLVEQYNKFYVPEVGKFLNGSNTLNENIADNSGIRHAFAAFSKLDQNKRNESKSGKYSLEQLFFINYAGTWCSEESVEYLTKLVDTNDHPPSRYRVLGALANMKEFAEAFSCPAGSQMNPENKCVLW